MSRKLEKQMLIYRAEVVDSALYRLLWFDMYVLISLSVLLVVHDINIRLKAVIANIFSISLAPCTKRITPAFSEKAALKDRRE